MSKHEPRCIHFVNHGSDCADEGGCEALATAVVVRSIQDLKTGPKLHHSADLRAEQIRLHHLESAVRFWRSGDVRWWLEHLDLDTDYIGRKVLGAVVQAESRIVHAKRWLRDNGLTPIPLEDDLEETEENENDA